MRSRNGETSVLERRRDFRRRQFIFRISQHSTSTLTSAHRAMECKEAILLTRQQIDIAASNYEMIRTNSENLAKMQNDEMALLTSLVSKEKLWKYIEAALLIANPFLPALFGHLIVVAVLSMAPTHIWANQLGLALFMVLVSTIIAPLSLITITQAVSQLSKIDEARIRQVKWILIFAFMVITPVTVLIMLSQIGLISDFLSLIYKQQRPT